MNTKSGWTRAGGLALLALLLTQTGCTTALKQAYYEVRGAKGDVVLVNNVSPDVVLKYESVEVEPVTTTLTPKVCPRLLVNAFNRDLKKMPEYTAAHYSGGGPKLTGKGEILYFQPKGLLGPALFLTRLKFYDGSEVVIDAILRVESKSFRDGDEEDIAEAGAKGLAEFFLKPKEKEAKRKAEAEAAASER